MARATSARTHGRLPAEFALGLGQVGGSQRCQRAGKVRDRRSHARASQGPGRQRPRHEIAQGDGVAGGDDKVLGVSRWSIRHMASTYCTGHSPSPGPIDVARKQRLPGAGGDAGGGSHDLAGDETLGTQRRLVIKQNAVAGIELPLGLAGVATSNGPPPWPRRRDCAGQRGSVRWPALRRCRQSSRWEA